MTIENIFGCFKEDGYFTGLLLIGVFIFAPDWCRFYSMVTAVPWWVKHCIYTSVAYFHTAALTMLQVTLRVSVYN